MEWERKRQLEVDFMKAPQSKILSTQLRNNNQFIVHKPGREVAQIEFHHYAIDSGDLICCCNSSSAFSKIDLSHSWGWHTSNHMALLSS